MEQAYLEFEKANGVKFYDKDKFLEWSDQRRSEIYQTKYWENDRYYFKTCHISVVAMLKMLIHAKRGQPEEIMGILIGQTIEDAFVITDVISLPVVGTETRVNASAECDIYMLDYHEFLESNGFKEQKIGWYHSHPSYKCWLSTIDCQTQAQNQKLNEPWIAVVVDPVTTTTNGAIEIGAFRTFPKGFVPDDNANGKRILPTEKIADFGASWNKYYTMKVEIFKTELDQKMLGKIWQEYWMTKLSATPIVSDREIIDKKIIDLHQKYSQKKQQGLKTSNACRELIDEIDEIGMIFERGLKSLQVKNMLFNQQFDN